MYFTETSLCISRNRVAQFVCICLSDEARGELQEVQVDTKMSHIILETEPSMDHSRVGALEAEVRTARTALDECIRKGAAAIQAIREVSPDAIATIQARVDAQVADSRKDLAAKEQALSAAKAEAQLGAFPPELNALIHNMATRLDRAEAYATRLEGLYNLSAEENRQLAGRLEKLEHFKTHCNSVSQAFLGRFIASRDAPTFQVGDKVVEKGSSPRKMGVVQSADVRIPSSVLSEHQGHVPESELLKYRWYRVKWDADESIDERLATQLQTYTVDVTALVAGGGHTHEMERYPPSNRPPMTQSSEVPVDDSALRCELRDLYVGLYRASCL